MVAVVGLAVALGLGLPAREVAGWKDYHTHGRVIEKGGVTYTQWDSGAASPFWPRYWRRLLGRPSTGLALCGPGGGPAAETCGRGHPEILVPIGNGQSIHRPTPEMREAVKRLDERRAAAKGR